MRVRRASLRRQVRHLLHCLRNANLMIRHQGTVILALKGESARAYKGSPQTLEQRLVDEVVWLYDTNVKLAADLENAHANLDRTQESLRELRLEVAQMRARWPA